MKKNGFIATSILYSFFLVFITLFVALITNYLQNRVLLEAVDDLAREKVYSINNLKLTDVQIGDSIRFSNIPAPASGAVYSYALNDGANWIVGDIVTSGTRKTYYLLSDFTAQNTVVTRKIDKDPVALRHAVTIDVMKFLSETNAGDGYKNDINFYVKGRTNGLFTSTSDFMVYIPKASVLAKIRNSAISEDMKNSILGVNGDYAVYIDGSYGGFTNGQYALLRRYNFAMGAAQASLVNNYCHATYNESTQQLSYTSPNASGNNGFGYTHVVDESVNKSGSLKSYVDYCLYASPTVYNHYASEKVVEVNESGKDLIEETFRATTYQYRLMMQITVDSNSEYIYLSGGRGTSIDPYLMTTGVKQS